MESEADVWFEAQPTFYPSGNVADQRDTPQVPQSDTTDKPPFYTRLLRPRGSRLDLQIPDMSAQGTEQGQARKIPSPTCSQLERQQELRVSCGSSTSDIDSSAESFNERAAMGGQRMGLGIDLREKPLPDTLSLVLQKPSASDAARVLAPDNSKVAAGPRYHIPDQMGFSFIPGDDTDILTQGQAGDSKSLLVVNHTHERSSSNSEELPEHSQQRSRPKSPPTLNLKSKLPTKAPNIQRDPLTTDLIQRDGSTSSIVTAVRDNSGRSCGNSSTNNGAPDGRPKLNRKTIAGTGNNEAVVIAAKAFAATKSSASKQMRPGPGSGSSSGSNDGVGNKDISQESHHGQDGKGKSKAILSRSASPNIGTNKGRVKK